MYINCYKELKPGMTFKGLLNSPYEQYVRIITANKDCITYDVYGKKAPAGVDHYEYNDYFDGTFPHGLPFAWCDKLYEKHVVSTRPFIDDINSEFYELIPADELI